MTLKLYCAYKLLGELVKYSDARIQPRGSDSVDMERGSGIIPGDLDGISSQTIILKSLIYR